MAASDCIIARTPSELQHALCEVVAHRQDAGAADLVFVAGPYRAERRDEVVRNVFLACCVAREMSHRGFAPVVPHALGALGCFGQSDVSALERTVTLVSAVAEGYGHLVGICREDGSLSEGTQTELEAYDQDSAWPAVFAPWSVWQGLVRHEAVEEVTTMWSNMKPWM